MFSILAVPTLPGEIFETSLEINIYSRSINISQFYTAKELIERCIEGIQRIATLIKTSNLKMIFTD